MFLSIFAERNFAWNNRMYFCAKFVDIYATGILEIGEYIIGEAIYW